MKQLMFLMLVFLTPFVWAADAVLNKKGVAVNGYDVVAYHVEQNAVKGDKNFTHNWNGVDWHFFSKKNLNAFKQAPNKYAPQYGGYCAYAVSKGSLAPTNPHAWTIHNGKLYLNYSESVRMIWLRNIDKYIARADKNWPGLK